MNSNSMMTLTRRLLVAAFMLCATVGFAAPASADSRARYTNGCTGVPDSGRFFNFTAACNEHDICYARFPDGSHQYGTNEIGRARCDGAFLLNMRESCQAQKWYEEPACFSLANKYFMGVRQLSAFAYYDNNTVY